MVANKKNVIKKRSIIVFSLTPSNANYDEPSVKIWSATPILQNKPTEPGYFKYIYFFFVKCLETLIYMSKAFARGKE